MKLENSVFLNVEKSVSGRIWRDRLNHEMQRHAGAISQQHGLSDVLSRVLAARGVLPEKVEDHLKPTLRSLMPDPSTLTDMDALVVRIVHAILTKETVAIFGDYDVDGASSSALMARYLRHFGLNVIIHIPDRIFEGYGPNIPAIDKLVGEGASLIITVDCGATSFEPLAHAKSKNIDVLVLDHHQMSDEIPEAVAVVNPNRQDDLSGLGHLCAAGVTFMALVATNRQLREQNHEEFPQLLSLIDLVALATVCDVVPLIGLNRAFVVRGLEQIQRATNPGIGALALASRQTAPPSTYSLGFMIGPRINAGGRIGDASLGAKLLSSSDTAECYAIAAQLEELNAERQAIEASAVEEAVAVAEREIGEGEGPAVLVLSSEHWHPGVVGLIASRLKDRFHRPAFAISMRPDGTGVGSGRSISGVDLGAAVRTAVADETILKGGGHAMAAGITVQQIQIAAFRAGLNENLEQAVREARQSTSISIDAAITARTANLDFIKEVARAGPFGSGNPGPIFAFPAHRVKFAQIAGKGGHVRATISSADGATLEAIAFRAATTHLGQKLLQATSSDAFHICGALNINSWQGREKAQLRIEDIAIVGR